MKNYLALIIVAQIIGGSIFFAVLFGAPYSNSFKVLATILFFFLSLTLFTVMVAYVTLAQGLRILSEQVSEVRGAVLGHQAVGETSHLTQALMRLTGGLVIGEPRNLKYLFLGIFLLDVLGGWFLRNFFG